MKVCAIIITQDRVEYVGKLLAALSRQTYKNFDIFLFNVTQNENSKIKEFLNNSVKYKRIRSQSAFEGYIFALKEVYEKYDWVWMLHDDTLPDTNALNAFVEATSRVKKVSFFTSMITTPNFTPAYMPPLSPFNIEGQAAWGEKLEYSLIRIAKASFISTFVNVEAIKKCGLPVSKFSFKENSEYLSRLIGEYGAGYLVGKSKVIHFKEINASQERQGQKLKICAIVVTYNRKEMLLQCLQALQAQKYTDFDILIVDNASTDGTLDFVSSYLSKRIHYVNTGANLGGSGGFYYGMKKAYEQGYDWIWIMDDDVLPTPSALSELVAHLKYAKTVSFLASAVYSKDNMAMNTPEISRYSTNGYRFWYDKLEHGMMRLSHATFVSLLINSKAIEKCGLPCKDYFIWGDDTEYTMRVIGKFGAAYMVGSSKVYHLRGSSTALNIRTEKNKNRITMYYYLFRNTLINTKTYSGERACKALIKRYRKDCIKIALSKELYRKLKIRTILRAIKDFKKKNYAIEAFNNRYQVYGQEKAVLSFIGLPACAEKINNEFGYSVVSSNIGISIFTLSNSIPSYIKEYQYQNISKITRRELTKNLLINFIPLSKRQYLVVDFSDSFGSLAYFNNEQDSFYVNFSNEFSKDLQTGNLDVLSKNYKIEVKNVIELTDQDIERSVQDFVLYITKWYSSQRTFFVKYSLDSDMGEEERTKRKFINKLTEMALKLMPNSQKIEIEDEANTDCIIEAIKSKIKQ